eukprot:2099084-Rhodomonas_salina.2
MVLQHSPRVPVEHHLHHDPHDHDDDDDDDDNHHHLQNAREKKKKIDAPFEHRNVGNVRRSDAEGDAGPRASNASVLRRDAHYTHASLDPQPPHHDPHHHHHHHPLLPPHSLHHHHHQRPDDGTHPQAESELSSFAAVFYPSPGYLNPTNGKARRGAEEEEACRGAEEEEALGEMVRMTLDQDFNQISHSHARMDAFRKQVCLLRVVGSRARRWGVLARGCGRVRP